MNILSQIAEASVCQDTVAGWVWYCDAHNTHGNADSEDEAEHMAAAHDAYGSQECDLMVWETKQVVPR